mgnify:CR=1 FL=1
MAAKVPVKAIFTGSDVTSLGEFGSSDTINGSYITDDTIDEANLKVSNNPINGYVLQAQSGASGGLTWVADSTSDSTKLPLAGGTMTGNLVMGTNLVDGIDISARDAILTSTTTTATAALPKAGGTITGTVTVSANAVGTVTTDNDGSFAMSAGNNFTCTPAGNFALTFTAIVAQSGNILFINSGGHTISAHANTKVDANLLATISTAGTYLLGYFSDGTNVYMTNSAIYT